jgi:mono/diheme cytochrome c family protein
LITATVFSASLGAQEVQVTNAQFVKSDHNGDGEVTKHELQAPNIFRKLDKNRDGKIVREEVGLVQVTKAQFDERDTDKDGIVTPKELPDRGTFIHLDANLDGKITLHEVGLQHTVPREPLALAPAVLPINKAKLLGQRVADFAVTDLGGKTMRIMPGDKPVAVILRDPKCPVAAKLGPAAARASKTLHEQGITVVILNIADDVTTAKKDLKAHGFAGHYVHDKAGKLAAQFYPTTTTETFLMDSAMTLRYRGALSDQAGIGWTKGEATYHFLLDAAAAVLAGRQPTIPATAAPGCTLDLRPNTADGTITWHNRVSRIMQNNCVECHRQGGPGPFAFETYEQVSGRRKGMIKDVLEEGIMPPWFASPSHGEWANDRRLSDEDRRDLLTWIDTGCALGDPKDGAPAKAFNDHWAIGKPDLILEIPQTVTVPAEGEVPYVNLIVRNPLKEDRWIEAYEIRPTSPEVVHHSRVRCRGRQVLPRGGRPGRSCGFKCIIQQTVRRQRIVRRSAFALPRRRRSMRS